MEIFAKPAVGAIIEKIEQGKRYILIQTRNKESGGIENGMTEIPAGKIREYENIFDALRREIWEESTKIKELLTINPLHFYPMHINALRKYCAKHHIE